MKRNTIETLVAFLGLGMIYYGAGVNQCLHATGQPAPNCHFTPTGTTILVVGLVVGMIGLAPWKMYARNYVCQLCGAEFGGGKEGKLSQSSHFKNNHPDFYKWDIRWSRWTEAWTAFFFVYIIGVAVLVGILPSLNAFTNWWALGYLGVGAGLVLDLADLHFVTKRFRNKWLLLHPEARNLETLLVEQEKLSAGVPAWHEFTRGQEQYFGGLMAGGLKKKGNFAGGYGVYFTSQRIIGVKTGRWFVVILVLAALAGIGGASAIGILVGTSPAYAYYIALPIILVLIAWGQRRLHFQDPLTLEELEQRKDFEIRREDLSGIDLKKPGAVRRGHLVLTTKTGKSVTIMITQEAGIFERMKGLVSGFCFVPPATWIKERPLTTNYPTPEYTYPGKVDDPRTESGQTQGILDERHVEQRDFEWCPHCATMVSRGTRVCPNCGKTVNS
jgi:hypothetical protein